MNPEPFATALDIVLLEENNVSGVGIQNDEDSGSIGWIGVKARMGRLAEFPGAP
jgi:hypothetical protein